jgi:outer membrane receptor protein involved in Fe transport
VAVVRPGSLEGVVRDDHGLPLRGAMVSALGATTHFATTDSTGRFTFESLLPGVYLVRAHLSGFSTPRANLVAVKSSAKVSSSIAMHRVADPVGTAGRIESTPVMTASIVAAAPESHTTPTETAPPTVNADGEVSVDNGSDHDHSEFAWRLRHLKRSVLKDATDAPEIPADLPAPGDAFSQAGKSLFGRAVESPVRLATALFGDGPLSGQLNLLTTGSFDSPQEIFSGDHFSHGVAYVAIGSPIGRADWSLRGAVTQGDLASWVLAGAYTTRRPATHAYDLGLSYSTQRYYGGNAAALVAVTDGSRNVGAMYGFDRWTITPRLVVNYGARYDRYDYLGGRGLLSPRVTFTITPVRAFHIRASASQRALAPGAEEFLPPLGDGVWLPPERTFAPLSADARFHAEHGQHYELAVDRDFGDAAMVTFRTFYQRVDDQIATLFGVRVPERPAADLGHYYVADAGEVEAHGWGIGISRAMSRRFRGSLDYTTSAADWNPGVDGMLIALWSPSALRRQSERVHDLTTSVETEIPQTATRVFVLYRLNTAFVRHDSEVDRPGFDARFDVQVRQSLPFMNFSSAQWEMLVAVRNLFREPAPDSSLYDELLVVRPPKRIVGGLLLRF